MRFTRIVLAMAVSGIAALGVAQTTQKPAFAAVSVKPSNPGDPPSSGGGPGTFTTTNVSLKSLVEMAFRVRDFQVVGGPKWAESDGWSINANFAVPKRLPDPDAPTDFELMLQSFLENRFQLKVHREMRDLPIYVLIVAKGGPKVKLSGDQTPERPPDPGSPPPPPPVSGSAPSRGGIRLSNGVLEGSAVPIMRIVNAVFRQVDRIVVDKTDLKGLCDVKLQWNPEGFQPGLPGGAAEPITGVSIFTALQEQLGLRLESSKGPVEVVVIDSAQRPTEN